MNHQYDRAQKLIKKHDRPMTERDLAVLLHAAMKAVKWERFDGGGTMAEDGAPAIMINTADGRTLIIEVREGSAT